MKCKKKPWNLPFFIRKLDFSKQVYLVTNKETLMLFGIVFLTGQASAQNFVALSKIQWEEAQEDQQDSFWSQFPSSVLDLFPLD